MERRTISRGSCAQAAAATKRSPSSATQRIPMLKSYRAEHGQRSEWASEVGAVSSAEHARYLAVSQRGHSPVTPHIRPISARSTVTAQRLTQDHARSFCTMKTGTARVFLRLGRPQLGSPPDAGFEASPGKTESNEKKNECVFIGS